MNHQAWNGRMEKRGYQISEQESRQMEWKPDIPHEEQKVSTICIQSIYVVGVWALYIYTSM